MSRPLRILYPGAWYHVMNRGLNRQPIFHEKNDFHSFMKGLRESTERWGAGIAAYCLMSTHFHLLIQTPGGNLPRIMRHIDGAYTQRFNRRHDRDGPLFRGRYKAILIDADGYLLEVLKYIHQNPIKAGLERDLGTYPWSSHHGYLSKAMKWSWLNTEPILAAMATTGRDSRKAYLDLMRESLSEETERFYSLKTLRSILGRSMFVQRIKDRFADALLHEEIPESKLRLVSLDVVIRAVCANFNSTQEKLCTPRRGKHDEARGMAAYLARRHTDETLRNIAARLGLSRHGSAAFLNRRFEADMRLNAALRKRTKAVQELMFHQLST
jgi:REP element-mobilizing transposase RayT